MTHEIEVYMSIKEYELYESKLKKYIAENDISCEHLVFNASCHSVADAARAANAQSSDFVKNICFIDDAERIIVAIVKGEDRVSSTRLKKQFNLDALESASPDDILRYTGYPCGGTPSFGFEATFIIDPKVLEREYIYTGGGSERALVKIATDVLKNVNGAIVERVRK